MAENVIRAAAATRLSARRIGQKNEAFGPGPETFGGYKPPARRNPIPRERSGVYYGGARRSSEPSYRHRYGNQKRGEYERGAEPA